EFQPQPAKQLGPIRRARGKHDRGVASWFGHHGEVLQGAYEWYNVRLMSRDFPEWIDPDKAAAAWRQFCWSFPLARYRLLDGMIANVDGGDDAEIEFRIVFGHDEQRQVRAEVAVSGRVPLRCERTLKIYEQPVESHSVVGIVADDRAAEALPEDYEPLLCTDSKIELVRLIGEEVLLGLPLVAIDPDSSSVSDPAPPADTHRPFAALADELRSGRDEKDCEDNDCDKRNRVQNNRDENN